MGGVKMRRTAWGFLWVAVVCAMPASAQHQVFDLRGPSAVRASVRTLPGEYIDPLTGGLSLSQVDLRLPGPAGFDLVIQRNYSSKFLINPGTPSEFIDWYGWTGTGWSLHMGRVRNAHNLVNPGPIE